MGGFLDGLRKCVLAPPLNELETVFPYSRPSMACLLKKLSLVWSDFLST